MNAHSTIRPMTATEQLYAKRVEHLGLASAAMTGLLDIHGPVPKAKQHEVMQHIDALFGFSVAEYGQASDMLFEATNDNSIADWLLPMIQDCARRLSLIAHDYRGDAKPIWLAGFDLLEIDRLWEDAQPVERINDGYEAQKRGDYRLMQGGARA